MKEGILKEDWLSQKVEIRETDKKGKGIFAISPISTGEKIIVWGGEYVNKDKALEEEKSGKRVMQWDDDLYSIETDGEDLGYFINHSCNPNAWMADAFTIVAKRDITIGDEVTADYVLWEARGDDYIFKWECKCGASNCRHRLTGSDWKIPELQERYRGHFSPLINKWIENKNKDKI